MKAAILFAAALLLASCNDPETPPVPLQHYTVKVINTWPHNPAWFTQGLIMHKGQLIEGTGKKGSSAIHFVDLASGKPTFSHPLETRYFGEGITVLDGKLYQLTWKAGTGFVYELEGFKPLKTFSYPGEGWGLTHDGKHLIMSDGSARLSFMDPKRLKITSSITVRDRGKAVKQLNELEYVDGEVWANVWGREVIARIDPATGRVTGWINCRGLKPGNHGADVLNGIAYNPETGRVFLTGKRWDKLYEVEVVPDGN